MPLLFARKEVFEWLKQGKKTIDVRKGTGKNGALALFQCGPHILRFIIVKREVGKLDDVVRLDNYLQIIPTAVDVQDAIFFTGYMVLVTAFLQLIMFGHLSALRKKRNKY